MKKHFWWMSVALWLPLQAAAQDGRFHSPVDIPRAASEPFPLRHRRENARRGG